MTTQDIAKRLVELCRKGDWKTAQEELFADDAVSIEPYASHGFEKETKGLPAIIEKGYKFESMTEKLHSLSASEPLVASNSIAIIIGMDITMKDGQRHNMRELCVYKVKDGKIISEEFYM